MIKKMAYLAKWWMLRPRAFRAAAELKHNEHESFSQHEALKAIVKSAFLNVPYYRKLYGGVGFELKDMSQDGWFEKLPVLTKEAVRKNFDELFNPSLRKFAKYYTTGGSTGVPTRTGYDSRLPEEVYSWRLQRWFGVNPWDDHAYIWRDTRRSVVSRAVNKLLWWPSRHLKLDASVMTEQSIMNFLSRYARLKPTLLYGYVGAVTQVAEFVLSRKLEYLVQNEALKCVWVTSAPITDVQRALLSDVFGAPVCDQYGSCEIRGIAQQCPCGKGLHVNTEHVFVEFVDAQNISVAKGEYGKTLLTNLEDTVFPLIRYENGDRGRWLKEKCKCGMALPCIDSVKGRQVESFTLPSGKVVNGEYLTTIFDSAPDSVRNFRVVQHAGGNITVEYVAGSRAVPEGIKKDFINNIGGEVPVEFVQVESICHDRGKLRFIVRE